MKSKRGIAKRLILWTILVIFSRSSFAYIDPGTTNIIFSTLGYLLAMLCALISILIWPLRRFFQYLNDKWDAKRKGLALLISVGVLVVVVLIGMTTIYFVGGF